MPTYDSTPTFKRAFKRLSAEEQAAFKQAVRKCVEDLDRDGRPRPGLRVKKVQGAPGVFEMTWAPDGRATFEYGPERRAGHRHIIWRAIGGHEILADP